MSVKNAAQVAEEIVAAGRGTTRQVLIGPDEGPHFALRRFIMQPGGGIPEHTNTVEHEQYVLCGRARIGIGERTLEVGTGDVVFIPAGTPHWYEVLGNERFEFLCVVPNLPDQMDMAKPSAG
jgi:quercetin dioxygenase-like cupin family protein